MSVALGPSSAEGLYGGELPIHRVGRGLLYWEFRQSLNLLLTQAANDVESPVRWVRLRHLGWGPPADQGLADAQEEWIAEQYDVKDMDVVIWVADPSQDPWAVAIATTPEPVGGVARACAALAAEVPPAVLRRGTTRAVVAGVEVPAPDLAEKIRQAIASVYLPLVELYDLVARDESDDALDLIWHGFDRLMKDDCFDVCEQVFAAVDVGRLDPTTAVGFLSATLPMRVRLAAREAFLVRLRERLEREMPEAELRQLLEGVS
jgi:hypothetical protein